MYRTKHWTGKIIMENKIGALAIIGMCVVVLSIVAFRRKAEFIMNFLMRAVFGTIGIYMINQILIQQGIAMIVGINPTTIVTSGILGFPGVVLLYGISLYKFL